MSGVSIDTAPTVPSETEQLIKAAFDGGADFATRMNALSAAKAQAAAALADLNLGKSAAAALADAQAEHDAGQVDRDAAAAALETAKQSAADTVAKANADATDMVTKATVSADALIAEAKQIHSDAQNTKTAADAALTAANAKQKEADTAFEVANRLAEQHETARATYEGKIERLNAFMQTESIVAIPATIARAS